MGLYYFAWQYNAMISTCVRNDDFISLGISLKIIHVSENDVNIGDAEPTHVLHSL